MNFNARVLQHGSESRVLTASLINLDGDPFPGVFKTRPGFGRFLTIDEHPLLAVKLATEKNLFDHQDADAATAQEENPELKRPCGGVVVSVELHWVVA